LWIGNGICRADREKKVSSLFSTASLIVERSDPMEQAAGLWAGATMRGLCAPGTSRMRIEMTIDQLSGAPAFRQGISRTTSRSATLWETADLMRHAVERKRELIAGLTPPVADSPFWDRAATLPEIMDPPATAVPLSPHGMSDLRFLEGNRDSCNRLGGPPFRLVVV